MASEDGSEQLQQKEEIELLSGIPFSKGPFETKKGPRKPKKENLYLNTTMRRFLLGENKKTGQVGIGERTFEVRQARHSAEDGRLRNIIHPDDVSDIKGFLSEELMRDPDTHKDTGVKFYCGEFKTKKGPRFPEGRTIYATAKLRKLLGIDEVPGSIDIGGIIYKVRQGKKPIDSDKFVNVVHPVEELAVQQFLIYRFKESHRISAETNKRTGEVLDSTDNDPFANFAKRLETQKQEVVDAAKALLEKGSIEDEQDIDLIEKALAYIETPSGELSKIEWHAKAMAAILAEYIMNEEDEPSEINNLHEYFLILQFLNRLKFLDMELAKESPNWGEVKIAINKAEEGATILKNKKGYNDLLVRDVYLDALITMFHKYEDRHGKQ